MQVVRTSALVAAPAGLVFDLARDVRIRTRGLAQVRGRAVPPGRTGGLLARGDLLSLRARHHGVDWRYDARVVVCERPHRLVDVQERGPWRFMRHEQRFAQTGAGTLVTAELCWRSPAGPLGQAVDALLLRRYLRQLLLTRSAHLRMVAEQIAGSDDPPHTVVGVVLVDAHGRVLAAERTDGGWEFPGGKVEPGESEPEAAVRECQEELGVSVLVDGPLDGTEPLGNGHLLRLYTGRIVRGEPVPRVHARLRWTPAADLERLDWLPADRAFLGRVTDRLGQLTD